MGELMGIWYFIEVMKLWVTSTAEIVSWGKVDIVLFLMHHGFQCRCGINFKLMTSHCVDIQFTLKWFLSDEVHIFEWC